MNIRKKNNVLPVYAGSMPKIFAETAPDLIKEFSNENLVVVDTGCGSGILGLSFAKDRKVKLAYEIDNNEKFYNFFQKLIWVYLFNF